MGLVHVTRWGVTLLVLSWLVYISVKCIRPVGGRWRNVHDGGW